LLNSSKEELGPAGKHKKIKSWNGFDGARSKTGEMMRKVGQAGNGGMKC